MKMKMPDWKFFKRFFQKTSKVEKIEVTKETSCCQGVVVPFIGSELHSSKAEAMAYILSETVRRNRKNLGDVILCSEVYLTIKQLEEEKNMPTVYELFPQQCWNAFWEMGDQGQIKIVPKDGPNEARMTIMSDSILAKMIWA